MTEPAAEKRVGWAELFCDLVIVFAVTQVSALLHHDHSWGGAGRALIVFIPIYWVWVGMSVHADVQDAERPFDRMGLFLISLCGLGMALAVPGAYGDRAVLFGAAYFAARIVLAVLMYRNIPFTPGPVSISVTVTGPLMLLGGFLDGPVRTIVWGVAALVDLATPRLTRKRMMTIHFDAGHLTERFGLLVIIALGESIVAIGASAAAAPELTVGPLSAVAAAFVIACGLWWVYFHFAASAIRHGLATASVAADVVRLVLSYGHLSLVGSIIAVAVGMAEAVANPAEHLHLGVAALLYGGSAWYLATFGYTRWRMFRRWPLTRLPAALVVLALLPVATALPALAALILLAVLAALLNVAEFLLVRKNGQLPGDPPFHRRRAPA